MPSVKGTDIIDDSGPSGSSAASLRSSSSVSPSSTTTTRKQRKCDPLTATPTGEKKQKKRFALLNILSTVWMLALMAVLVKPFLYPRPLFVPPYQQLSISPSEIIGQEHVAITVSAGESEDNDALVTSPFTSSISFLNASITAALNLPPAVDCIRVISLRDSELLELFIRDAGSLGFLDRLTVQLEDRDPRGGRAGCWEAHKRAAQAALEQGCNAMAVFEDDAYFTSDWPRAMRDLTRLFEQDERETERGGRGRGQKATRDGDGMMMGTDEDTKKDQWSIFFLGSLPGGYLIPYENSLGLEAVRRTGVPLLTHAYVIPRRTMKVVSESEWEPREPQVLENVDQFFADSFGVQGLALTAYPSVAYQRKRPSKSAITPIHDAIGGDTILLQVLFEWLSGVLGLCTCALTGLSSSILPTVCSCSPSQ